MDGTDGSDFSKREVVAEHYQRIGHAKAAIKPWLKVQQGLYVRKTPQRSAARVVNLARPNVHAFVC